MRKRIMGLVMVSLMAVSLSGTAVCAAEEDVTPASLAEKAGEMIKEQDSFLAALDFVMDADIGAEAEGMSFGMGIQVDLDLDVAVTMDPEASYMTGSMAMSMSMGDEAMPAEEEKMESYSVQEDGVMVTYQSQDGGETWTRQEGDTAGDIQSLLSDSSVFDGIVSGDLEAELVGEDTYNGEEVYVVTATMPGEYLQEALNMSQDTEAGAFLGGDVDLTGQSVPAEFMFYKESGLPACIKIDMSELGKALLESSLGGGDQGMDMNMDIYSFYMEIGFSDYGNIAEISVPDEVKAVAAESVDEADEAA